MLRLHEQAKRAVQSYGQGAEGELVVGLMPTMTRCALAPVLDTFTQANPNVRVKIVEGYSGTLTQQIRAGELDFAIVPAFAGAPGLTSRLFLTTPEVLVSSASASAHASRSRAARRPRPAQAGGARQAQHAPHHS